MKAKNKKQRTTKRVRVSLHLLMCGVLLSTTVLPIPTALAETKTPTTDSSTPVPTLDSSGTDLTTDKSKTPESETPTVPSTDSTTEDTTEPTQETPVEEPETETSEPTTDSTVPSDEAQLTQDTQRVPQLRSIITDTWGTSPVSFDDSTGVLTVYPGTIAPNADNQTKIGNIEKNKITKIIFKDGVYAPVNSSYLFNGDSYNGYTNLETIEGYLNTSNVTNMDFMFGSSSVTTLDLSKWDTSNVTSMMAMFYQSKATALDLSKWDTSNVTSMMAMFYQSKATALDLSKWDTSNVTSMVAMFNISQITSLDVSKWDTSNVTNMSYMFSRAQVLSLDVSKWDTSNVTNMSYMFSGAQVLSLDVSKWDTSNIDPDGRGLLETFSHTLLTSIKLGEKSKFNSRVLLPSIDTASGEYTGKWERIDPKSPISEYDSSNDFMNKYDGSLPGTYIWQRAKAQDLTVFYQDTEGNDISKSKTVSGNVGDTFNETPLDIEGYTFKEVKDNAPTEGTLTDKEQSITFIYTKKAPMSITRTKVFD